MTETRTVTLTEFLLARITADEEIARRLLDDLAAQIRYYGYGSDEIGPFTESRMLAASMSAQYGGQTRWRNCARGQYIGQLADPARVQVECEAKRRLIELHAVEQWYGEGYCQTCVVPMAPADDAEPDPGLWPCPTIRALASVYADHPDFNPAWK